MKKLLLSVFHSAIIFAFIFNFNSLNGQSWQWAKSESGFGSDGGSKTCTDAFGNVYVGGYFNSTSITVGTISINNIGVSGADCFVAKYNSAGTVLWATRIGGTGDEGISGMCTDAAGRVYITGSFSSPVISISPLTYGNAGGYDVYLTCLDGNGVTQWLNAFGSTGNEFSGGCAYSNSVASAYVTGYYSAAKLTIGTTTLNNTSATGKSEIFLAKYNTNGFLQWAKTTGAATSDDYAMAIDVDASGYPCIGGSFSPSTITGTTVIGTTTLTSVGFQDFYIAKYTDVGNFQFARSMGSNQGGDYIGGLKVDASNNIFFNGYYDGTVMSIGTATLSNSGSYDVFTSKYNSAGVFQWVSKIGGGADDYAYDLSLDANSNVYVTGSYAGTVITAGTFTMANTVSGSNTDIFVAKYNTSGTIQWITHAISSGFEWANGISSDAVGNVYTTGYFDSPTGFGTTTVNTSGGADAYFAKIGCLTTNGGTITSVCQGLSTTLTASGATTYSWSTGATTPSITVSPTVSSVYTATGTSGACAGTPATFSVTFLPASLSAGSNLNMLCKQKAVINATCNPASPTSVVWSPATNLSSASVLNPTVTSASGTTNYTVTTTLSNGCMKTGTVNVSSYAQTPDICQVTVDSLGNNNEIYWEKTLYPQADSFIVYRETSTNVYTRIAAVSRTLFSMYTDTNRSIGPFNGNPNLTYYKYKLQIKDSCGNVSPKSLWHETIFVQDQLNGNFNWNSYAIELSSSPVSSYNLKRRDVATGTETLVVSTGGNLATDPAYNSVWPNNIKWFVDAIGFNCVPSAKLIVNNNNILVTKTKTKSNQSNDKLASTGIANNVLSNAIRVYPNPSQDILNIDLNALSKTETDIEIQNSLGQLVYATKSLNQFLVINTSDFIGGIYIINIKQNDKLRAVKKLVIEK